MSNPELTPSEFGYNPQVEDPHVREAGQSFTMQDVHGVSWDYAVGSAPAPREEVAIAILPLQMQEPARQALRERREREAAGQPVEGPELGASGEE